MADIAVVHSAPSGTHGAHWGDSHYADVLADALRRGGRDVGVFGYDLREGAIESAAVVVLRGLFPHLPALNQRSVLWVISHSDLVTDEELDAFDHVCVASSVEATRFATRTSTPVHVLHQATDLRRFRPPGVRSVCAASGIVVVANNRWLGRRGPRWLRELGIPFELYGLKWDGTPEEAYLAARRIPNKELAGIYATADLVVADQWRQMARDGFVANRLFDVAAAGGFVVSDDGPGVTEVFGDLVPTYATRAELGDQVDRWLGDPAGRSDRSDELAALVRREHGFDARAARLRELLGLTAARRVRRRAAPRPRLP